MKRLHERIVMLVFLLSLTISLIAQNVANPNEYGLKEAKTGEERYVALLKCHKDAQSKGMSISYAGIDSINLEIPQGAVSIPLTENVDFAGTTMVVKNNSVNRLFLFELSQKAIKVEVGKRAIDRGDVRGVSELRHGLKLLIIEDNNLWVDNRVGYQYGAKRKDVLLLKNGRSRNDVVAPYNNAESDPTCTYCEVTSDLKVVRDLNIIRDSTSKMKIYPFKVENQNNVLLKNITLITPPGHQFDSDRAVTINNSTNVTLQNVKALGSYSQQTKSGYVFGFNNLWNTTLDHVDADAVWGVIGTNNMSQTILKSCIVNRFDIHCYGRDVHLMDCTIRKSEKSWYCGGSSIYGTIRYDRCTFYNTSPYANGDSYKTYVPNDVVFNDCVFEVTKSKCSIVSTAKFNNDLNPRKGLSQKCLPNLTINNMKVIVPKGVKQVYLYNLGKDVSYDGKVGNISRVTIKGLELVCEDEKNPAMVVFSTSPINTAKKVRYKNKNVKILTKKRT